MSVLSDNYKRIISEIENKVSNKDELEFVKQKIAELSMMFMDIIDTISETTEERIKQIEDKQVRIEEKINKVEKTIDEIEDDIYLDDDDNSFEFEIVCPYCNNQFITEINNEDDMKKEIQCPECHNIIELDWNDEDEDCQGHCHTCSGCSGELKTEDEYDDNTETETDEYEEEQDNSNQEDIDDDM